LIRYRAFQNWDPPAIAEIWRHQVPLRGLMQPITPAMLEELVFAKPYFDRHGLILAVDGARPVGFVHAGFGASDDLSAIDYSQGTTCLLMVGPHERHGEIAVELLAAAEDYLRKRGATSVYAGCQFPFNPFYLGLYGSSSLQGVLASDKAWTDLVTGSHYTPGPCRWLMHRPLAGFRAPVDARLMQVRRKFQVRPATEALPDNWWEACVWSHADWWRFDLMLKNGGEPLISATFWEVLPLARAWGVRTMGLVKLDDTPEARHEGLTTFLLGEAFREMQASGIAQVEVQADEHEASLIALFQQLGFQDYDRGVLYCKPS
jgi:GNAT superfamily N-acetyltransferase